ncbi:NADPH2:quinone reductase [Luteibacter sp. Sphag1AF]|uniref:NAD(P)H-quinone oxidoreductase n=1 Tax=Luteibacter sp. Sphag1AF TaxID=2587031 RepID=UPI00183F8A6A|nr:NAD(P)H-quinone oxidoreductase [Luteibacter sp. Sphag1AF]MBB3226215.1 NADPH2:quinone reductase [Luteibacter sp. Sphag1AF]
MSLLPSTMKAVEISRPGPPDVLTLVDRPVPSLRPGDVLIRVAAAGINRADTGQRAGTYPPPPGASDLPGLEVSGRIVAMGADAGDWKVGDAVCALVDGGGYAQYVAVPAGQCLPVPKGLNWIEAAALPETCFTVWTNVFDRARLIAGETFLVHGGSSGIGTTAIPLARALGARVFTTVGTKAKADACLALGAERAINYRDEDFVAVVKSLTDGAGVDVILDMVGGDYAPRNINALAMDGRLVMIALPHGRQAELDLGKIIFRRLTVTGSGLRALPPARKAHIGASLLAKVWPLIEAGTFRPIIHATFLLSDAAAAHALMEDGSHIGKIMLDVDPTLAQP